MKKTLLTLLSIFLLTPTFATTIQIQNPEQTKTLPQYFRDVSAKSKLNIAIDSAISRGILEKGSFFRPDSEVPAVMFLDVLLRDAGIEPKSRRAPQGGGEFSDILNEAVAQGFIDEKVAKNLKFDTPLTKLRVLKAIIKSKKLLPPRYVSKKFRGIFPNANLVKAKDLPYLETAVASGIISEAELKFLRPNDLATRREFITWIYNYADHGTRKIRLEADPVFQRNQRAFRYNSRLKPRFSIERRNAQLKKIREKQKSRKKKGQLTIKPLQKTENLIRSSVRNPFPGKDIIDEIYDEIVENYRFADDLTPEKKQEMQDRAFSALVQAVGDKYSVYIPPKKSAKYLNSLEGKFEGIGAYVEMVNGKFTIIAPIKGSPAEEAGLQAQDVVTKVDGKDVEGMAIGEIVDLIMGPAGTKVNLEISRRAPQGGGDSRKLNFTITRAKITEPAVVLKWEKGVPIIEIHQFNNDTIKLLNEILPEILAKKPRGLVLDLRNNPGGLLSSAIDVGSLFLKKDDVIFYTQDRVSTIPFVAEKDGILKDFKNIVVLQNRGTASASEILIGALQDYGKVKIIGETSLGKGTAQNIHDLKNGGLLKLTVAKWLTPKKRWINEKGIKPDLEIPNPTPEERKRKIDKQLDAAIREVLY